MQLSQLDGYETCLHHTALALQAAGDDSETQERLLPALMLDIKAFELMQHLTSHSQFVLTTQQRQEGKPQAAADASTTPSGASATTASLSTVPGCSHNSRAGTCRTARCLAAISTDDVRECRSLTAQQLAGVCIMHASPEQVLAVMQKDSLKLHVLHQTTRLGLWREPAQHAGCTHASSAIALLL
jgi:hypothetical protein